MVDEGEILISVHKVNDDIIIRIKDNGVGMSEEQVESIFLVHQRQAQDYTLY